jgi:predicted transcriptional regulator
VTSITIRVPDELKKKMKSLPEINWSEVVRRAIASRVNLELAREGKDWAAISKSGTRIDGIYEKLRAEHGSIEFDSSETVRYWRDRRYGATS